MSHGPGSEILRVPRRAALVGISVLVGAASLVSFAESYRGLYLWSSHHGLHGLWAAVWPLQIDVFIAIGELALFVALADRWRPRSRIAAWLVTVLGLAVSVAGNVGHVTGHSLTARATAAVPPLAAAAALAVGLGVLKRVVEHHHAKEAAVPEAVLAAILAPPPGSAEEAAIVGYRASVAGGNPLSQRALSDRYGIPRSRARKLRAEVAAAQAGAPMSSPRGTSRYGKWRGTGRAAQGNGLTKGERARAWRFPTGLALPLGRCPVTGCGQQIDPTRLMCRPDWYRVPKSLRDRVWASWRSGHAAASRGHREAVLKAIRVCGLAQLPAWRRQLVRLRLLPDPCRLLDPHD